MQRAFQVTLLIASSTAISSCVPAREAPLEPVKIGVLSSTSGALGSFGSSLQKAVFLAQEL